LPILPYWDVLKNLKIGRDALGRIERRGRDRAVVNVNAPHSISAREYVGRIPIFKELQRTSLTGCATTPYLTKRRDSRFLSKRHVVRLPRISWCATELLLGMSVRNM
jgi:hypothetical protein